MSAGIDYGLGRTNVDQSTGIRFGVISQHSIMQAWSDSAEADYGPPICPKCGHECQGAEESTSETYEQYEEHGCAEFACDNCELTIDSSDAYGDEPIGWNVDADGYKMTDCLDSDVMILESPFYTFAPYCSPCVPGAGDLDDASEGELDGVKTYCCGHDWFEDGFAPYDVFSVATGQLVPRPPTAVAYGLHSSGKHYLYASTSLHETAQSYMRAFWIVPGTLDPSIN